MKVSTLGWEDARSPMRPVMWTYVLPDALGSVRQELVLSEAEGTDATGAVTAVREWSPYGVEVGTAQAGLGYTGEWYDSGVGLQYLRARWYVTGAGVFTSRDPVTSEPPYQYVRGNPINVVDPSGKIPRPPDVCPFPSENTIPPRSMFLRPEYLVRKNDGTIVNRHSLLYPGDSMWWYCGDFGVTAYQFVTEVDSGGNS